MCSKSEQRKRGLQGSEEFPHLQDFYSLFFKEDSLCSPSREGTVVTRQKAVLNLLWADQVLGLGLC